MDNNEILNHIKTPQTISDGQYKRGKLPKLTSPTREKLWLASLVVGAAFVAVAVAFPKIHSAGNTETPPASLLLIIGLNAMVLTTAFLLALRSFGLKARTNTIVLAITYNSLVILAKFVFAPLADYQANQRAAFDSNESPNSPGVIALAAVGIFLLYVIVYRICTRIVARQSSLIIDDEIKKSKSGIAVVIISVIVLAISGAGIYFLFLFFPEMSYLGHVFSGQYGGLLIITLIAATVVLFYALKSAAEDQALFGGATWAIFVWGGLILLFLLHVMWVVMMATLVSIWPFRTYTSK